MSSKWGVGWRPKLLKSGMYQVEFGFKEEGKKASECKRSGGTFVTEDEAYAKGKQMLKELNEASTGCGGNGPSRSTRVVDVVKLQALNPMWSPNGRSCGPFNQYKKCKADETCPICMENLGKTNICTTKCGHQFCLKCMLKHSKQNKNCPMCRADVPGADYLQLIYTPHVRFLIENLLR